MKTRPCPIALEAHDQLILWADAGRYPNGYGVVMKPLHVLGRDARAHVWDYVVASAMVAVAIVALVTRIDVQDADVHLFHPDTWWSWAVTIAICASLVGRRRWPLQTFAIGLVLTMSLEFARHRDSVAFFALLAAFYAVAAHLPLGSGVRGVAMLAAVYAALGVGGTTIIRAAPLVGPVFFVTAFALGRMLQLGRSRQLREVEAAIERSAAAVEVADLQAADERLRLAQELHDVVAHSLSIIAVQAGIGVHLIDRQPAEAAHALDAIRSTSTTAAGELSRLVEMLRAGGSTDSTPAPALGDVTLLIEQIRTAGLPVTYTVAGDLDAVPAGVSLAAYRIVQEALTNVVRHAGRAQANVSVRVTEDQVELCIDDDGRGAATMVDTASPTGGHGLIGMSERAKMYGGEVRSGPRPGGGFRVRATLRYFGAALASEAPTNPHAGSADANDAAPTRRRPSPWVWDVMLAGLMAVLATVELVATGPTRVEPNYGPAHVWAWLLRLGCCLALTARRRYPSMSLAAIWVLSISLKIGGYQHGVMFFALLIGVYAVASYSSTRKLVCAVIVSFGELAIIANSKPPEVTAAGAVWACIIVAATAIAGYVARRERERRTSDLAEREVAVDAQSRRALLVITTERLRIADELSTIIARSIHTIAHEASSGSHTVDTDPMAARETLEAISAISRDALNDLRRLLKRMRTESEPVRYAPITSAADPVAAGEAR
jgi:signal transduction histidine kinase